MHSTPISKKVITGTSFVFLFVFLEIAHACPLVVQYVARDEARVVARRVAKSENFAGVYAKGETTVLVFEAKETGWFSTRVKDLTDRFTTAGAKVAGVLDLHISRGLGYTALAGVTTACIGAVCAIVSPEEGVPQFATSLLWLGSVTAAFGGGGKLAFDGAASATTRSEVVDTHSHLMFLGARSAKTIAQSKRGDFVITGDGRNIISELEANGFERMDLAPVSEKKLVAAGKVAAAAPQNDALNDYSVEVAERAIEVAVRQSLLVLRLPRNATMKEVEAQYQILQKDYLQLSLDEKNMIETAVRKLRHYRDWL